jgi:ataxin-3
MSRDGALDDDHVPPAIYHEKQVGSMCGQHCLNNLLQGPYFSAGDLSDVAADLDNAERELMLR